MSAIVGFINLNGNKADDKVGKEMIDKLNIYKLDNISFLKKHNVFMACGMEYITPESVHEILPFYDIENKIMITADAIIDNREELFSLLNIQDKTITDSQLILQSYLKWGKECPKKLVGDFAFVIYDEKNKELFCVRDHVAKRTFYYYYKDGIFAFSTLIKPIFPVMKEKPQLNEEWITEYLSLKGVVQELQFENTLYEEIHQLLGATSLTIKDNKIEKKLYWDPLKEVKPLKLNSEEEYHKAFLKVYEEAVRCRLRCIGNIGISLSGGLDSSSVAALAARILKPEKKVINGYSSMPLRSFDKKIEFGRIADESEYIEELIKMYPNIKANYCRAEDKDSLSDVDFFNEVLEQPHKIIENLFWINDILKNAKNGGCKVLLIGQSGNNTVSYGDFTTFLYTLYKNGHFIRMKKEVELFEKVNNIPHNAIKRGVKRMIIPYKIRAIGDKKYKKEFMYKDIPVNLYLAKKYDMESKLAKINSSDITMRCYTIEEERKAIVNPINFMQAAMVETKLGLAQGIMERDPTRDKRVIEFCLSLPFDEFVKNGYERYLIRSSFKGILPEKIRMNLKMRGLQGADWAVRLQPQMKELKKYTLKLINNKKISKYLNRDKVLEYAEQFISEADNNKNDKLRMMVVVYIFSLFINEFNT